MYIYIYHISVAIWAQVIAFGLARPTHLELLICSPSQMAPDDNEASQMTPDDQMMHRILKTMSAQEKKPPPSPDDAPEKKRPRVHWGQSVIDDLLPEYDVKDDLLPEYDVKEERECECEKTYQEIYATMTVPDLDDVFARLVKKYFPEGGAPGEIPRYYMTATSATSASSTASSSTLNLLTKLRSSDDSNAGGENDCNETQETQG